MFDVDGFSIYGEHEYSAMQPQPLPADVDDFGFDPAPRKSTYPVKIEQTCGPPDDSDTFSDFSMDPAKENSHSPNRPYQLDRIVTQSIPNTNAAISRYGQVTPPRSNSESSIEAPVEQKLTRKRRATKSSLKEEPAQPVFAIRKRRHARKNSTVMTGLPENEEEKRKQSLEKNRLAAFKCRNNKKEKIEQLQRDSHDNALQNAFLKEQIMRMKEEVKQINALLLAHTNCEGWKSPEDIQKLRSDLGNDPFAQDTQGLTHKFLGFANISFDHSDMAHDRYLPPTADLSLINPPLPDFDTELEFNVSTPMETG